MSHPSAAEIERLTHIQTELREVVGARGHRVGVALDADPAFGSGFSRASLRRDLALDTIGRGAKMVGVGVRPRRGGARDLVSTDQDTGVERHYRCLKAETGADGSIRIYVNSDSGLTVPEEPGLIPTERWVFAWTFDGNGMIQDVVIAEVTGYESGKPGGLILGTVIALGKTTPPPAVHFEPDQDEDLFGDEREHGDEQGGELTG